MLTTPDIIEIHHLLAEYGNIIDERDWDRVSELFTDDAEYDLSDFGSGVFRGAAAIRAFWEHSARHPLAHHVTNVVVREGPDGSVHAFSKIIAVGHRNKAGSATYRDELRKTEWGWRIARRVATPRRSEQNRGS
jgi:3-phenylpropionate/cinnamic acid dioxygenase small subunit